MKKIFNKTLLVFIISMFLLTGSVFAGKYDFVEAPYTEEYKKYMELSDEEKSKILEPRKYDISNNQSSTKDVLLKNEKISLKNLINVLKSSTISTSTRFSLKDIISNNLAIRNQKNVNACWAFASISSLETNLALKNYNNNVAEKIYDFSERHMAYAMSQSFLPGQTNKYGYTKKIIDGGTYLMSTAYLTNGQGAVSEEDMPFVNTQEDIDISQIQNKDIQTTVNDIIWFDAISDLPNADATQLADLQQEIKEHVSTYGSVYAGVYAPEGSEQGYNYMNNDTGAIYTDEIKTWIGIINGETRECSSSANHAVSIIGWNDEYDKNNFKIKPNNNGAWIVRNSWGEKEEYTFEALRNLLEQKVGTEITDEQFNTFLSNLIAEGYTVDNTTQTVSKKVGDNGIFYVSYEDVNIYRNLWGIVSASDSKNYDNIYQVDELGANRSWTSEGTKTEDIYVANVFTRDTIETEYLTSVGISSFTGGTCEVYINPDGNSKSEENLKRIELSTGNEINITPGYNTINFQKPYKINGDNFVIALKMKHTEGENTFISLESSEIDYGGDANASSNPGESFVVFESDYGNDSNWVDIGDASDTDVFLGNLCIKGITVKDYDGEIANPDEEGPGEDIGNITENNTTGGNIVDNNTVNNTTGENIVDNNTVNNTTGGNIVDNNTVNNTTGGNIVDNNTVNNTTGENIVDNNTVNNTTGGNIVDNNTINNTTGGDIIREETPKNSDYSKAKAYLAQIAFNINGTNSGMEMKIEIKNIQVDKLCDKYEHYFYICSDSNKVNIPDSKWKKAGSFEKQSDGTYTLSVVINDESQLSDITKDSDNAYIYIKEIATNDTKSVTTISKGMEVIVNTSGLDINTKDEGEKVVTYTPTVEQTNGSTTDKTTASKNLPKTGIKTVLIVIGALLIIFIISYIKYRNMKDI